MKAHQPVPYDMETLMAVRALEAGNANEGQQRTAYNWIIHVVCQVEGMSYCSDAEGGERATAFHEGRRFAGNQIRKMSNPITLAALNKAASKANTRQEAKPNE